MEDAANAIIKESLRGVTRASDKLDILTPWKEMARKKREVLVPSGTPDSSNRKGVFHRRMNSEMPHLNSTSLVRRGRNGASSGPTTEHHDSVSWDSE